MKKYLLATVAFAALGTATSAFAADLAPRPYTKAPPMMVAVYDWTGFYIGANGGYASARKNWNYLGPLAPGDEGSHDADGGVFGGQIGYNWQSASWVFGLEAQGDWADLTGSNVSNRFPLFTNRSKVDALGLFTGRVGYAWNNTMLYVKGGAAVANDKYNYFPTATGVTTNSASETRWGATVGVGLEYGFTPNWSFGVEYDHIFMGRRDIAFTPGPAPVIDSIRQDVDMITARINYRWGGPVVARY
ncbi:outer membrane beta-barrel protein [Tardiphaga sp.]|uniref:outer membrane protein n=1 Tax=Tardiphaga sp. TaxID=1926292 RepID=UPI002620D3E8|nr:outer membrane beta-barrel protein [Tardiphaga sp.]MDB5616453.1 putative outer-rane protein precursor [Tardiphaga sp.]